MVIAVSPASAQRLAGTVIPEHYTLSFAPDLTQATFQGEASIDVQLLESTRSVTLHAAEMTFDTATVAAGGQTQMASVTFDARTETVTLTAPQLLPEGPATLHITYRGVLNDELRGFYLSEANGRRYAVTQLEATDARRAFPSFDEPVYKATFDISLVIDAGDTAISNGALVSDTPGPNPGKHTLQFARTAKMSTYLVAMVVGDFVCREGGADGTPIRICSTPDKRELTGFALEAAEQQLQFFNRYFDLPYPFGKLDIIAVPDFAAGAMENTGAITFRERLLLVDPSRAALNTRKSIASILAHEIAHQWFGNLVTMRWWDDIWLNEGFATWLANKPLAEWRPEWNVHLDDAADTQSALGLDALGSTRAIQLEVETPDEINQVFDGIAYEKAAAVLRMVEQYVGPDLFRRAITSYLAKYSYANASGADFWQEMALVTGQPVDRIIQSFVEQPGVPLLSVRASCVNTTSQISIEQGRFTTDTAAPPSTGQVWTVPACFRTAGNEPRCEVINRPVQTVSISGCDGVFANADSRGYYFTEYSPDGVRALAAAAAGLEPIERLGLLGDEWWIVRSGRHDVDVYLDLAGALAGDATPAVGSELASRLSYVGSYLLSPAGRPAYQGWIRERFGPSLAALGLPGDADDDDDIQARRATLLSLLAVTANDSALQQRARAMAEQYLDDPGSLSGTLARTVLRVGALNGDADLYDRYMPSLGTLTSDPEEYYRFFSALPWFRDPALVSRTLEFALSPGVRTQDTATLIAVLLGQSWGQDAAWAFTRQQWNAITEKLGTSFQGIPALVSAVGAFCSAERATEVRTFFSASPVPSATRTLRRSLERIDACTALASRQSTALAAWLRSTP